MNKDSLSYFNPPSSASANFETFAGYLGLKRREESAEQIMLDLRVRAYQAYSILTEQKDMLVRDRDNSFALFGRDLYLLILKIVQSGAAISVYDFFRKMVHGNENKFNNPLHFHVFEREEVESSIGIYQEVMDFMRQDGHPGYIKEGLWREEYGFHVKGNGRDILLPLTYNSDERKAKGLEPLKQKDLEGFLSLFDEVEDHTVHNGYPPSEVFKIMLFISQHRRLVSKEF